MDGWQSHRTADRLTCRQGGVNNWCSECDMVSSRASRRSAGVSSTVRSFRPDSPKSNPRKASEPQVNLLLQGTPAPRCARKPTRQRFRPQPPPNSPSLSYGAPPLVPLPIDRIMVLRERLDMSVLSVHSSLMDSDKAYAYGQKSDHCARFYSNTTPSERSNSSKSSHPCVRINSRLSFSDKASSFASSQRDLSIDLTSLTDSDHETDSSLEADNTQGYHSGTESSRRTQYFSSPLFVPPHRKDEQHLCRRSSYFSSETSSDSSKSARQHLSMSPFNCSKSSSSLYPASSQETSSRTHSRRSTDLICVYVDTVSNTHLAKYLRPCVTCHQPCCVCPEDPADGEGAECCGGNSRSKEEIGNCGQQPSPEKTSIDTGEMKPASIQVQSPIAASGLDLQHLDDGDKGDVKLSCEEEFPARKSPEFSPFMTERVENQHDSGNCTLEEKSHSSILSRRHVSLSLMQLSTAAQCARILADSLEGVLQLAKDEVSSLAESPARSHFDSSPDSLQNALDTLKRAYPKDKFEPLLSGLLDGSFSVDTEQSLLEINLGQDGKAQDKANNGIVGGPLASTSKDDLAADFEDVSKDVKVMVPEETEQCGELQSADNEKFQHLAFRSLKKLEDQS